jgi:hypothetical protein
MRYRVVEWRLDMLDTFFIALTLIFFALSLWYVGACEKL